MRNLLFTAAAAAAVLTAVPVMPAMAQVHVYGDEGGIRFGFGPRHAYRDYDRGRDAYADCRTVRERTVTSSGRVIVTTRRTCD